MKKNNTELVEKKVKNQKFEIQKFRDGKCNHHHFFHFHWFWCFFQNGRWFWFFFFLRNSAFSLIFSSILLSDCDHFQRKRMREFILTISLISEWNKTTKNTIRLKSFHKLETVWKKATKSIKKSFPLNRKIISVWRIIWVDVFSPLLLLEFLKISRKKRFLSTCQKFYSFFLSLGQFVLNGFSIRLI